jgi:hypothetical protein
LAYASPSWSLPPISYFEVFREFDLKEKQGASGFLESKQPCKQRSGRKKNGRSIFSEKEKMKFFLKKGGSFKQGPFYPPQKRRPGFIFFLLLPL